MLFCTGNVRETTCAKYAMPHNLVSTEAQAVGWDQSAAADFDAPAHQKTK